MKSPHGVGAGVGGPGHCQNEPEYIRYSPPEAPQQDPFNAYTLDDDDLLWLRKHSKNGFSCAPLDADLLEVLIQQLEATHQENLLGDTKRIQEPIKAGNVPDIPPVDEVLSKLAAVKACAGLACAQIVKPVYDHWREKFGVNGGPLLQHFWFEQPWKARSFKDPKDPARIGIMPFNAMDDTPSQHRQNVADQKSQARTRDGKLTLRGKRPRSWQDTAIALGGSRVQPRKLSQEVLIKKLFAHARRVAEAKRNHHMSLSALKRQAHAACVLSKVRQDRAAVHSLEVQCHHGVLKASITMNDKAESRKAPWQRRRLQH